MPIVALLCCRRVGTARPSPSTAVVTIHYSARTVLNNLRSIFAFLMFTLLFGKSHKLPTDIYLNMHGLLVRKWSKRDLYYDRCPTSAPLRTMLSRNLKKSGAAGALVIQIDHFTHPPRIMKERFPAHSRNLIFNISHNRMLVARTRTDNSVVCGYLPI